MGLFGLFYGGFLLGSSVVGGIKKSSELQQEKSYAASRGEPYYWDGGKKRDLYTNHIVDVYRLFEDGRYGKEGDLVMKDLETFQIIRNFTQEEREKEEEKNKAYAIAHGGIAYRLGVESDRHLKDKTCPGYRYKDLKTGEIYVIRGESKLRFFMRISDGHYVCETKKWRDEYEKKRDTDRDYIRLAEFYTPEAVQKRINEKNKWADEHIKKAKEQEKEWNKKFYINAVFQDHNYVGHYKDEY